MGGHGGLNILPQKSWNVYGRENRLKVSRDEAKAAAEQAVLDEKNLKAEREFRHALLLKRAAEKAGALDTSGDALPEITLPDSESLEAAKALEAEPVAKDTGLVAVLPSSNSSEDHQNALQAVEKREGNGAAKGGGGLLDFLKGWEAEEANGVNPEKAEEQKREARKRGQEATQTSDPKFDSQFAFANGLAGASNQPWYARRGSTLPEAEPPPSAPQPQMQVKILPAASISPDRSRSDGKHKHESKHKDKRKHRERHKHSKKEGIKGGRVNNALGVKGGVIKSREQLEKEAKLEALREERRLREEAEREKAKQIVLEHRRKGQEGVPTGSKRYHSGFGNARRR